jgi:hypothetical protein
MQRIVIRKKITPDLVVDGSTESIKATYFALSHLSGRIISRTTIRSSDSIRSR